jgi:hypothetical protein
VAGVSAFKFNLTSPGSNQHEALGDWCLPDEGLTNHLSILELFSGQKSTAVETCNCTAANPTRRDEDEFRKTGKGGLSAALDLVSLWG